MILRKNATLKRPFLFFGKPAGQQKTTQLGYISTQFNSVTTQLGVRSIQLQINWDTTQFRAIYQSLPPPSFLKIGSLVCVVST